MTTISLRLPDSLHQKIKEFSHKDGISLNQFINSAVAEKMSSFLAKEYLDQRAKKGSQAKFRKVLSKIKS